MIEILLMNASLVPSFLISLSFSQSLNVGIWKDDHIPGLARIVSFVKVPFSYEYMSE